MGIAYRTADTSRPGTDVSGPPEFGCYLRNFFSGPFRGRSEAILAAGRRYGERSMICGGMADGWWIRPWHPDNFVRSEWPTSFMMVSREEVSAACWAYLSERVHPVSHRRVARIGGAGVRLTCASQKPSSLTKDFDFADWLVDADTVPPSRFGDDDAAVAHLSGEDDELFFVMLSRLAEMQAGPTA